MQLLAIPKNYMVSIYFSYLYDLNGINVNLYTKNNKHKKTMKKMIEINVQLNRLCLHMKNDLHYSTILVCDYKKNTIHFIQRQLGTI